VLRSPRILGRKPRPPHRIPGLLPSSGTDATLPELAHPFNLSDPIVAPIPSDSSYPRSMFHRLRGRAIPVDGLAASVPIPRYVPRHHNREIAGTDGQKPYLAERRRRHPSSD
jgi:hypothetical protein